MDNHLDEKMLIARSEDAVTLCEKQNSIKFVGFLTPAEAETVRRNLSPGSVRTMFFGGYPDAERTLFVALPDYLEEEDAGDLVSMLEITGRDVWELKHPDFLGSLLGLGIRRDKIGDILVLEDRCLVFVVENSADYIIENLTKVGRRGVKVGLAKISETELPKRKVEIIQTTVAALRLDSIVAAAMRTSRTVASAAISEGRVFVNWVQVESSSHKIKPGDVFSVRGAGRFRLSEETRETKKGRIGIYIEKMM